MTRPARQLERVIAALKAAGIRVSLFVDPGGGAGALGRRSSAPIAWSSIPSRSRAPSSAARSEGRRSFETYARVARLASSLGLGVNAGHDLDLDNLVLFRRLPHLDEVSIGHALVSHALFVGLRPERPRLSGVLLIEPRRR